jgi:hypothetical protein
MKFTNVRNQLVCIVLILIAYKAPAVSITVNPSPVIAGITSGGGTYPVGSPVVLTATATNDCYTFTNWSDGSIDNPHTSTAFSDTNYTAHFAQKFFRIQTGVSPPDIGTTTGDTVAGCGSAVTLIATPTNGCWVFTGWSDGSTDNPHTITASSDTNLMANFAQSSFSIQTAVAPHNGGTATGDTMTNCGAIVTVTATPDAGHKFLFWTTEQWVFGSSPPRFYTIMLSSSANYKFVADGDLVLTANFAYTNNPCTGSILPEAGNFKESGGSGTVKVSPHHGCGWTYDNVPGNIHITGVTTNSLKYTVDPLAIFREPGNRRFPVPFTFLIAGQTFTILQGAEIQSPIPPPPNP